MAGTVSRALLLTTVILTAQLCRCTAVGGDGFSVELIHRDSNKSPFHDPSLAPHERLLAAARRSMALARSYAAVGSPGGAVSEVISRPFEYVMYVNIGTPPTRMPAMVDTGSDLVWLRCSNDTTAQPPNAQFHPPSSSTFGRVGCASAACHALPEASCDAAGSSCKYDYSYADGSETIGVLSTETFTFDDAPGGCLACRERPQLQVANVNFGCSTGTVGSFGGDGLVGLGNSNLSLVSQIGARTSLGRRFSYCLAPFSVQNASSALNFGARAAVTEPGAVTTPLVPSNEDDVFYTISLEAVKIGNATFALPSPSKVILDSGSTLSYLDKALLDPMVEELKRRINLPRVKSPDHVLQLCYDVTGGALRSLFDKNVPDVTLQLAGSGGAVVTLKAENTFAEMQEGVMCMAIAPVSEQQPASIIGNIAQQNLHVGYDLDKGTITLAAADCASSYHSPSASL